VNSFSKKHFPIFLDLNQPKDNFWSLLFSDLIYENTDKKIKGFFIS